MKAGTQFTSNSLHTIFSLGKRSSTWPKMKSLASGALTSENRSNSQPGASAFSSGVWTWAKSRTRPVTMCRVIGVSVSSAAAHSTS